MSRIWVNGRTMRANASALSPADRGFLLGDGVFETILLKDGMPHRWWAHLERMNDGLNALGIAPLIEEVLLEACQEIASSNGLTEGVIRLTISRGPGGRGLEPDPLTNPTVVIEVNPLPEKPSSLSLMWVDFPRRNPASLSARCKVIGYSDMMIARNSARQEDADMAILLSVTGEVACCDSANLFWFSQGVWKTPALSTGAMPGVTRTAILKSAEQGGEPVMEVSETRNDLSEAEAVCVTNSILGVVPVVQILDRCLDLDHPAIARLKAMEQSSS